MANAYIGLYKGTVTAGGTDGTRVSEGDNSVPVSFTLNATTNEVGTAQKLALRCTTNYQTNGSTTVSLTGTTAAKWALAPDNAGSAGTFGADGASLTIASVIGATNTIFWARAKATSDETPVNDTTVDISVSATIEAV